jgi:catechol 2,3-dioxygenase-like lactoylglutathione lyase family enzyme
MHAAKSPHADRLERPCIGAPPARAVLVRLLRRVQTAADSPAREATVSTKPNGVHHIAICTSDIKQQIAFFSDVLGMELVALYWMHGVKGAFHGFMKLNDHSSVAFVQSPDVAKIEPQIGKTHSGNPGAATAAGTLQHLAFNVTSDEELLAMRDRIRSRGVQVFGPIDHGFCKSIYFAGPEHLTLEVSTSREAIDADAWIDPEVVGLSGITAEELAAYRKPAPFTAPAPVAQPASDTGRPQMVYPPQTYANMLRMTDEQYTAARSDTEPPVKVARRA